ncbi:MAG: hypothetical protein WD512_20715, partial [Candidatus Paceibacterota bacterium]
GSLDNATLVNTDVSKRGILGRPKEFTDYYYVNESGEPLTASIDIPFPEEVSNKTDRAINRGERQIERNEGRQLRQIKKDLRNQAEEVLEYQEGGQTLLSKDDEEFNFYRSLEDEMYGYSVEEDAPFFKRGGQLPKAFAGLENTPVSYTSNPAFEGQKTVDFTAPSGGMNTNLPPSNTFANMAAFNPPPSNIPVPQGNDMYNSTQTGSPYSIKPYEVGEEQNATLSTKADKPAETIKGPQGKLIAVNRKRQDMRTIDPEAALNTGLAGIKGFLGKVNQSQSNAEQRALYENNYDPLNMYATKSRIDKGDFEVNQGSKRINETGSERLGRSKKYGGPMSFKEGGQNITYMSEEQVRQFLAAGGEIEFL